MNWYYGINEQQYGPVDFNTLKQLAAEGKIGPRDLVWNQSMGEKWAEACSIPELVFSESASPLASVPAMVPSIASVAVEGSFIDSEPAGFLENREITSRARASLAGKWGLGVGVTLLNILVTQIPSSVIPGFGGLISLVITGPISVGIALLFLNIARNRPSEVGQMFEGFKSFGNALGTYLVTLIFIILWMLLLIVPGIIASLSYAMVYFILADHPDMGPTDCITLSKNMMRGYKWQYFCLGFRFLGWMLLSILTLGIGLLWVIPYMQTSYAHFYEMVRRNYRPQLG